VPGDQFVAHTLAATGLVVRLHEADRAGTLDLIEVQTEPSCWRGFLGPMGARLTLRPDLFARLGVGALEDRWMVELDLATEATGALLTKFKRYQAHRLAGNEQREHGIYPRVLWAVPDQRRIQQVEAVLDQLPAETRRLFDVCRLDEAVPHLAAEASK
jgi:hypothetical protein